MKENAPIFADRSERVRRHTADHINDRIDAEIAERILHYTTRPKTEIAGRIEELDREWDVEQVLETNASTLALAGLGLGVWVSRKWLMLTGGVLGFLLLHGVQGWCPPLPVLRRLGVRTRTEIDREKVALRSLRGDFDSLGARKRRAVATELASAE
jgi:hypothetical protein